MRWKTAVSGRKNNEVYVRGLPLAQLMREKSFSEAAFLLFGKRLPTESEKELFDMLLVSICEHGVEAPSAFMSRVSASVGNPMNAALAAGILGTGDWHGGAIEEAARYLQQTDSAADIVAAILQKGGRLSGYGHKIYKDKDPRAEVLLEEAAERGIAQTEIAKARALGMELEKQSGKKLVLNIDMAVAALITAFGFDWRLGKALFVFARMPGMIAHAHEEILNEKPYRRIDEGDVDYIGPTL